jgi:hypothetical protein
MRSIVIMYLACHIITAGFLKVNSLSHNPTGSPPVGVDDNPERRVGSPGGCQWALSFGVLIHERNIFYHISRSRRFHY